jgi:predicted alpha/beta-fold hydrolase
MLKLYPEIGPIEFPKEPSLRAFEDLFATTRAGFANAKEYYDKCSSIHFIPEIKIPSLIVSAADDPVVDSRRLVDLEVNNNIDVLLTEKGGHVGFLGWGTRYDEVRWADQAISNWIDTHTGT